MVNPLCVTPGGTSARSVERPTSDRLPFERTKRISPVRAKSVGNIAGTATCGSASYSRNTGHLMSETPITRTPSPNCEILKFNPLRKSATSRKGNVWRTCCFIGAPSSRFVAPPTSNSHYKKVRHQVNFDGEHYRKGAMAFSCLHVESAPANEANNCIGTRAIDSAPLPQYLTGQQLIR